MILEDDEALARLENENNLVNKLKNKVVIHQGMTPGRPNGTISIPPSVKKLLTITALTSDETQQQIADTFHSSQHTISNLSRGLTSKGEAINPELIGLVRTKKNEKLENAHELALDALTASLTSLTTRLPEVDKPEKLAKIASDMSKVMNNISPKDNVDESLRPKVVFFAPNMKVENHYETLDV